MFVCVRVLCGMRWSLVVVLVSAFVPRRQTTAKRRTTASKPQRRYSPLSLAIFSAAGVSVSRRPRRRQ